MVIAEISNRPGIQMQQDNLATEQLGETFARNQLAVTDNYK